MRTAGLKKWRILLIICCCYLLLKVVINAEPVISVRDGKLSVGLFNFYKRPEINAVDFNFAIMPILSISPFETDLTSKKALPPFSRDTKKVFHLMGTDHLGRDVFAGFVSGFELAILISLVVGLLCSMITLLLGGVGAYYERFPVRTGIVKIFVLAILNLCLIINIAWYFLEIISILQMSLVVIVLCVTALVIYKIPFKKEKARYEIPIAAFNRRLQEFFQPIPDLILLMLFVAILNDMSLLGLFFILILLRIPSGSYFMQGIATQFVSNAHIDQARVLGLPDRRILAKHLYPLMLPGAGIFMVLTASRAVLSESALAFLGIGPTGDYMSWGVMIRLGLTNLNMWWVSFFPIAGLVILSLTYQKIVTNLSD